MDTRPRLSICFDDNNITVNTVAFPIMQNLGLIGSIFPITGNIGSTDLLSQAQLQELYDAGWDIGNHTLQHKNLTEEDDATVITQVASGRDALVTSARLWTRSADMFVYPFNAYNATTQAIVAQYARYATTSEGYNVYGTIDLMDIKRQSFATKTVAQLKAIIDYTVENSVYTHLYGHGIAEPIGYNYPPDMFEEVMEYVALKVSTSNLEVLTCSQFYRNTYPSTLTIKSS